MNKFLIAFFMAGAVLATSPCKMLAAGNDDLHIIPQPQEVVRGQGSFSLSPNRTFCANHGI